MASHAGESAGQFPSISAFFSSKSFKQGAKNMAPVQTLLRVLTATKIQSSVTATENIVARTLKNVLGSSLAICAVLVVNTPRGNVNPHQPMLNGNLDLVILAAAKKSHTSPKPHITVAVTQPNTKRISPELTAEDERGRVPVLGKSDMATDPSCIIAKPPCPRGPRGRKTETMTSRGGRWWSVRRWKYITRTTIARGTPVPQRMYEMITVQRACWLLGRTSATIPPDAAATMVETIGSNQIAVMVES